MKTKTQYVPTLNVNTLNKQRGNYKYKNVPPPHQMLMKVAEARHCHNSLKSKGR